MDHPELLSGLKTKDDLFSVKTSLHEETRTTTFNCEPLKDRFGNLYRRIVNLARAEKPIAKPLGLAESLKVRVITKGPPLLYTALKPIQKFLWNRLRKYHCFRLIGQKVSDGYVNSAVGLCENDEVYLSVDYTDATNELYSFCSDAVIRALYNIGVVDENLYELMLSAMTRHLIDSGSEVKPQTRGQLMGSIISFPILCIINAAILRFAHEKSLGRSFNLDQVPMAINGDDAILRSKPQIHDYWQLAASRCGLSPSVGKVYISSKFLNINSRSFVLKDRFLTLIPYVNMGILNQIKRSAGMKDNDSNFQSYGALATSLIEESPESIKERVLGQFIFKNSKLFTSMNVPWFLPEHLLGLGLPTVGKYCLSSTNAAMIPYLEEYPKPRMPSNGWTCRKYALDRFKPFMNLGSVAWSISATTQMEPISLESILGLLSVEALFRVDSIKSLYKPNENLSIRTAVKRYYRDLSHSWRKIHAEHLRRNLPSLTDIEISDLLISYQRYPSRGKTTFFAKQDVGFSPLLFQSLN